MSSPFLALPPSAHVASNALAFAIRDGYPVSEGHTLIVTRRMITTWFEATRDEHIAVLDLIDIVKTALDATYRPDGYNVGFNAGLSAGQTVMHLHVHVIPRYAGDMDDPRGGVRHVIPRKGNYLLTPEPEALFERAPHAESLVYGTREDPLLAHLGAHLDRATGLDAAVAFVLRSGVDALHARLEALLERGGRLRLVTGDYLDATDPDALARLVDLAAVFPSAVELRAYETRAGPVFHPKAYVLTTRGGAGVAFVGSSNLSGSALRDGVEWNYRVVSSTEPRGFASVRARFDALFSGPGTVPLTPAWLAAYRARRVTAYSPSASFLAGAADAQAEAPPAPAPDAPLPPVEPNAVQREALAALERTRAAGNRSGLVVMATGLGKTWLAALDAQRFARVLFVAHRDEILRQALATFRRVRPGATLGFFHGTEKSPDADIVFASIQTLGRASGLGAFARDRFDYVVVDEFHHAAAPTYRALLDHFEPEFLLGLTATPDRTDGQSLLGLCAENLVYRADLFEGIERELLAPFHYFGVPDVVEYAQIPWRRYTEEELTRLVATEARAQNAISQLDSRGGRRVLAFCASVAHADFMTERLRASGRRAAAVHSGAASAPREEAIEQLTQGELDVLVTVDMFNEGVDIPAVDTVLLLRPTDSQIVWYQQIGRGLRKHDGKDHLRIIDYVGNHRAFLGVFRAVLGLDADGARVGEALRQLRQNHRLTEGLPPGCEVTYDLEAIDLLERLAGQVRDRFVGWVEEFVAEHERAPTATEAFHARFDPRQPRGKRRGGWFEALGSIRPLSPERAAVLADARAHALLEQVGATKMTRSYKMLALLAWLDAGTFPDPIGTSALVPHVQRRARRAAPLALDLSVDFEDVQALARLMREMPLHYLTAEPRSPFTLEGDTLGVRERPDATLLPALGEMMRELADWRLAAYLEPRRREHRARFRDDRGAAIDAQFTIEETAGGFSVFLESGGKKGSEAARNTQYSEGLRLLLARLAALDAVLELAALATAKESAALDLAGADLPVPLARQDLPALQRAIHRAQGNNSTRRIHLQVRLPRPLSIASLQATLSHGGEPHSQ